MVTSAMAFLLVLKRSQMQEQEEPDRAQLWRKKPEEPERNHYPVIAEKGVAILICLTGISVLLVGTSGPESNHMTGHTALGIAPQC